MTNKDIIESVLSLLALDGAVNKWEMTLFNDLCERLEISKEEKNAALTKVKQGKGRVHLPEEEADKKRLIYFLMQAVVADGKVGSRERDVLNTVVDKLGISRSYVSDFIESRLQEIKTERYTETSTLSMECPKCGYEQAKSFRCRRCGIIFEKYKKEVGPSDEDTLRDLFSSVNKIAKSDS